MPVSNQKTISKWMSYYAVDRLDDLLGIAHQYVTVRWYTHRKLDDVIHGVMMMKIIHDANLLKEQREEECLPYSSFYNDAVNTEELNYKEDYRRWRHGNFSFAAHSFILDPATKSKILRLDAAAQMTQQFEEAIFASLFTHTSPYLILKIHRDHILRDTLTQIQGKNSSDLKKPLKVKFEGEAGIDEGGVQKEFFQLLIAELFDPKFGMLTYDDETNTFWFNKDSLDSSFEFELIGILLGLAIYNGVILDVRFPHVVYKKLMNKKATLKDLIIVMPELGRGLQQLLEFDGDVEETYCRHFAITYDVFGEEKTVLGCCASPARE